MDLWLTRDTFGGEIELQRSEGGALEAAAPSNARENVQLSFEHKVKDYFQDMADSNFKL